MADEQPLSGRYEDPYVGTRERPRDRGLAKARSIVAAIGQEIRNARRAAGLSLRTAAASVGLSYSTFARIERGMMAHASVAQLALACAAVGLELTSRAFPNGDPVRDRGQVRLIGRLRAILPGAIPLPTEVPLPIAGDLRSVDAASRLDGLWVAFEAETRLVDIQAMERRVLLKQCDGGYDRLILVVADTRANRLVLELHRETMRANFPLDGRRIRASLRQGKAPISNGIVVV